MNKFLIFFAALLCAYQFSIAQTEKGNQTLGLYLQFQYSASTENVFNKADFSLSSTKTKNTSIATGPIYSYFIADNTDVGGSFSLGSYSYTYPASGSTARNHNRNYEGTIFMRRYFLYANKIGIRTGPFLAYNWGNQEYNNPPDQSIYDYGQTNHGYTVGAKLEAVYYPSKHFGLSALLADVGFQHSNSKSYSNGSFDNASGNGGFFNILTSGFGLSLCYVFGGK